MQMLHEFVPDSANERFTPSRGAKRRARRSRAVSYKEFTYDQLKSRLEENAGSPDMPARSSLGNLNSALNGFLESVGIESSDKIGANLRLMFYKRRAIFIARLEERGRPSSYIANQKSSLKVWHRFLVQLDREEAANDDKPQRPFQSALKSLFMPDAQGNRATIKGTSRAIGIPLSTIRGWLAGNAPKFACYGDIMKLESFFGLEKDALMDLLPHRIQRTPQVAQETAEKPKKSSLPPIDYRVRQARLQADPYVLNPSAVQEALKRQWVELLTDKTQEVSSIGNPNRWATRLEVNRNPGNCDWATVVKGRVCHTARYTFQHVQRFCGFLELEKSKGGLGLPPESAQTLAHFANIDAIVAYINWKIERADKVVSNSVTGFLTVVKMLSREKFGYLPNHPAIGATIGIKDPDQWREICKEAHETATSQLTAMKQRLEKSRDPFAPIRAVLDLPNPLTAVRDAMTRHRLMRPSSGAKKEAAWCRDHLLIGILASNPLRARNIRQLTWRSDNSGDLYKDAAGGWRIRIRKSHMKNRGLYDAAVNPTLWKMIELYIREFRPKLYQSTPTDLFFLNKNQPDKEWSDMDHQFARLFGRLFVGCHPCGPHAMRHIVATAILKIDPGAFTKVAQVLHDRIETVMHHYAFLSPDDSADILDSAFRREAA